MRVPFFCRTLPMLLPAVPASVSATDSHISPPPAPIRSNPFVRRAKRDWGPARFWRGGGAGASGGGDHEGERWPSRGRAALFSAARPCLQVPRLVASGSGRCPVLPVSLLLPRPLLDWMGGGGGLVASSLMVVGRVCGTGRHVCDVSIFFWPILFHVLLLGLIFLGSRNLEGV